MRPTYWGSIIDTNLSPDEEIFFYSGNELVEIFRDKASGTDLRFNTFHDYLGSVRQIVTDAANPVDDSRFDYTAYALNDTEKDYSGLPFSAECPYKFAGIWGYYDGSGRGSDQTADGMILCGQRFYVPQIARWLTEDPIGFAGGINLYEYSGNGPTYLVDPRGTSLMSVWQFLALLRWIIDHFGPIEGYGPPHPPPIDDDDTGGPPPHWGIPIEDRPLHVIIFIDKVEVSVGSGGTDTDIRGFVGLGCTFGRK